MERELKISEPLKSQRIVVRMPAAVAYDLGKFQEIQKDILRRIGCGACTSGHDIRWMLEQNFLVDEQLNVHVDSHLG